MTESKIKRGFACLPKEEVVELGKKGGNAAQATGKAHRWSSEAAREAGRKGALARHQKVSNERLAEANRKMREVEGLNDADIEGPAKLSS